AEDKPASLKVVTDVPADEPAIRVMAQPVTCKDDGVEDISQRFPIGISPSIASMQAEVKPAPDDWGRCIDDLILHAGRAAVERISPIGERRRYGKRSGERDAGNRRYDWFEH